MRRLASVSIVGVMVYLGCTGLVDLPESTGAGGSGGGAANGGAGGVGGGSVTSDGGGPTTSQGGSSNSGGAGGVGGESTTSAGGAESCILDEDCTADPPPCQIWYCADGTCELHDLPDGPAPNQTAGDCREVMCTDGVSSSVPDDEDPPSDPCLECDAQGNVVNVDPGVTCPQGVCDGAGDCVGCLDASHCFTDLCTSWQCTNNTCVGMSEPDGTSCGIANSCCGGDCCPNSMGCTNGMCGVN